MKILKKACVFTGMAVGAGFASGREITDFFLSFGESWKKGLIFGGILFFLAGSAVSCVVRKKKINDYSAYLSAVMGERSALFTRWVSGLFFFVMFFAMVSASGSAAVMFLGIPYAAGTLAFILICGWIVFGGMKAVEDISVILVPFLMLGMVLISMSAEGTAETLNGGAGSVYISAVIYVSYNVIAAPYIIIDSERSASPAEDIFTGLLCGAAMTGMGLAAGKGILSVCGAAGSEFPLARVAASAGKSFSYCYRAVFLTAVLTTAVCNALAAVDFACENLKTERKRTAAVMLAAAFPLSFVSFSAFVSKIYPLFGLAGILQLTGSVAFLLRKSKT